MAFKSFDELNKEFRVKVLGKLNSKGLLRVGPFKTYRDSREYLKFAQRINCDIPEDPVWPEPREERCAEDQEINRLYERNGSITVHIRRPVSDSRVSAPRKPVFSQR